MDKKNNHKRIHLKKNKDKTDYFSLTDINYRRLVDRQKRQEQQNSEVNIFLKSRVSYYQQRKTKRSMSVSLANSQGNILIESDQVKSFMLKQVPEVNIYLNQAKQSGIITQSKINTPRLLKYKSNFNIEENNNQQFALQAQFKNNKLQYLDSQRQNLIKCEKEINELETICPFSPPFKITNTNSKIFKRQTDLLNYPQLIQSIETSHSENQSPETLNFNYDVEGKSEKRSRNFKDSIKQ
ncbi:hypothetical protein ABPG72_009250 [Tetrahymena utriculariae]